MSTPSSSDAPQQPAAESDPACGWVRKPSDVPLTAEDAATKSELRESARAQCIEMEKYQWYLGVQLNRDPLLDRTKNEICAEWIECHAAKFRAWWESNRRAGRCHSDGL